MALLGNLYPKASSYRHSSCSTMPKPSPSQMHAPMLRRGSIAPSARMPFPSNTAVPTEVVHNPLRRACSRAPLSLALGLSLLRPSCRPGSLMLGAAEENKVGARCRRHASKLHLFRAQWCTSDMPLATQSKHEVLLRKAWKKYCAWAGQRQAQPSN